MTDNSQCNKIKRWETHPYTDGNLIIWQRQAFQIVGKRWDQSINGDRTTDHIEKNETGHVIL